MNGSQRRLRSRRSTASQEAIRWPPTPSDSMRMMGRSAPRDVHSATLSAGARLTYRELLDGREEPRPAVQEDYRSRAQVRLGVRYPPPSPHEEGVHTIYLHRVDDPEQAYSLTGRSISLSHHHPDWGDVHFGVIFPRSGNGFAPPSTPHEARHVAIKQLRKSVFQEALYHGGPNDPYKEIAFLRELGDNIHVLKLIEALEDDVYLYIITPRGLGTMVELIPWGSPQTLDPERVQSIFRQLLNILLHLERHNVCHRDLSPDNILFLTDDNLVAFDFGLSLRIPVDANTGRRYLMQGQGSFGTPPYMSPEVIQNDPYDGVSSDLWSVAVILFNLLTNHVLYDNPVMHDVSFLYFILAGGLSSRPRLDRTEQVLQMVFQQPQTHGHGVHSNVHARVQAAQSLDDAALELLENVLNIDPHHRWSLAQVLESDFCDGEGDE